MASPILTFHDNIKQAVKMLDIHEEKTGNKPGRRYDVEVLNKSCIVLTTACWEAFVEDITSYALNFMINESNEPSKLPKKVLQYVSKVIKEERNDLRMFDLAGDGWKQVLLDYKDNVAEKYLGHFNTPKHGNVDELMMRVIGIEKISSCWYWKGMSNLKAKQKLNKYISLRGEIAHLLNTNANVTKSQADDYAVLVIRLAIRTSNRIRRYVYDITGKHPYRNMHLGSIK